MNRKRLIVLTIHLSMILTSISFGQDLIETAQSGLNTTKENPVNRIAEHIEKQQLKGNFSAISLFKFAKQQLRTQHTNYVTDALYLEIDNKALQQFNSKRKDYIALTIPVAEGKSFEVELMEADILSDDFKMTNQHGKVIYSDDFPGVFYQGIVKGDPNSIVSLSIFDDHIAGLISDDYGNYILGKVEDISDTYILYNDKNLNVNHNFTCHISDDEPEFENKPSGDGNRGGNIGNCVSIFIEADYAMFQSQGENLENVANFAAVLFNQSAIIYNNEGILIKISELMVWTEPDPYIGVTGAAILSLFRSTRDTYSGDMAHLISTRSIGARAYRSGLCNQDIGYAASGLFSTVVPFPTYSWNVHAFTHETGHNFGSRHTHACAWNGDNTAIDGCYPTEGSCPRPPLPPQGTGTIMSYCHLQPSVLVNFNLGFGPQPGDLIRNNYYNATCLNPCNEADCPVERHITNIYNNGDNIDLEASDKITASNIINSGAVIDYDAGMEVKLKPGFLADYGSVFRAFIDGCSGARLEGQNEDDAEIREPYGDTQLMLRNYPNPFNGQTVIEYELVNDSPVTLIVTNITGKQIEVLSDNEMKTKGVHRLTFNGHHYPSGVYYYTIQAGEHVITQKMILVKH